MCSTYFQYRTVPSVTVSHSTFKVLLLQQAVITCQSHPKRHLALKNEGKQLLPDKEEDLNGYMCSV